MKPDTTPGRKYPCDKCEYIATKSSHLKQHKESKHEGVRYPCDECTYIGNHVIGLKRHKENKHWGVT